MTITADWSTLTFFIPQADLANVIGSLYELDTENVFRAGINALMASEEGIVFEDPISHNTSVTVAGTTFARTIELVNGYNVTFTPDSQYSVRLAGSNNNLFDVENGILNQNQVQVIAQNSAGLIESGTSGLTAQESTTLTAIHGNVRREIWLDPTLVSNGDGRQQSPYNNITDAIDDAEANGITGLVLRGDITLNRNLKNFSVRGVGDPTIDFAGFDLKGCSFIHLQAQGSYTSSIHMEHCGLLSGMFLNGSFEECELAGDLTCVAGGTVYMRSCASGIPGLSRPTISMNPTGTSKLSVRDYSGGLTIKDCNLPTDEVTVEVGSGSLTFDSSCTDGNMVARTTGKFVDETAGATVTSEAFVNELWKLQGLDPTKPMTATPTSRTVDDISLEITGDGETSSTVTRT